MAYEIDFISVEESEAKDDADAIAFRWKDENDGYKIGVYDGGLQAHGKKMAKHLNQYYFSDPTNNVIDCVICSHSDLDHVSGLKHILEEFEVKRLYMNRPWLYIEDVWDSVNNGRITVNNGRITKNSLCEYLKKKYNHIYDLEKIAEEKGIEICEAFQGEVIEDRLEVLSPSKEFYLELMIESSKTPLQKENITEQASTNILKTIAQYIKNLTESWKDEKLKENVKTSAENEMSVVILGKMDEENFLLTGDAGIRALDKSIIYAENQNEAIKDTVKFLQIPHHGGRHNVSPSILNRLIGEVVNKNEIIDTAAFVSVAQNSNHPLQMVVNAFVRRGVKVYKTDGGIITYYKNTPNRDGWHALEKLNFEEEVEEWNN